MGTRACIGAIAMIVAILALGLREPSPPAPARDDCADSSRLETADPDMGRLRLLSCPSACVGPDCPTTPTGSAALLMGLPIRLDLADADELGALPGIGPGLARRILRDRDERGPVRSLQELG
ncbi:MAG TPA: helix-hairpin-helix domain-containing protein, partial [Vulgatibacter sp.]